ENGRQSTLTGEVNMFQNDHASDVDIRWHLNPNTIFKRDADNILYETSASSPKATQAGLVDVPPLDGRAQVKIPPGTRPGTLFRLEGKGLPSMESHRRGDELVRVNVDVPLELRKRQRELLQEFAHEIGDKS